MAAKEEPAIGTNTKSESLFESWKVSGEYPAAKSKPEVPKIKDLHLHQISRHSSVLSARSVDLLKSSGKSSQRFPPSLNALKSTQSSRSRASSVRSSPASTARPPRKSPQESKAPQAHDSPGLSSKAVEQLTNDGKGGNPDSKSFDQQSEYDSFSEYSLSTDASYIAPNDEWDLTTTYHNSFDWIGKPRKGKLAEEHPKIRSRRELLSRRHELIRSEAEQLMEAHREKELLKLSMARQLLEERRIGKRLENEAEVKAAEEILKKKRQEYFPDRTFDLDGDGIVGVCDFYISKKFDANKNGRLEPEELMKAKQAIADGFTADKSKFKGDDGKLPDGHYFSYQDTMHRLLGQANDKDEWEAIDVLSKPR